ncbi:hypothetical protein BDY24DRAFT_38925 [Mrakia frigida]|uniref:Isa2p n=1 Tax=Mrakia frigida TaxID=29902 RepID=UPI003FCC1BA8
MAPRLLSACLRRTQTPAPSSFLSRASSSSSSSLSSVPPSRSILPPARTRLSTSSSTPRRRFLSTVTPIDHPHPSSLLQNPASPTSVLASSASTPLSSPPPISVTPPSSSAIAQLKEDGMNIELVPEDLATIKVTDSAWKQLTKIGNREKDPGLRFRIAVESGGCHGYQYKMELTNELELDDYTFSLSSTSSSDSAFPLTTPIVIDSASLGLLKGATIDFATELIGSSFRIAANPQAKGSGCGCGVSWEAI